MLKLPVNLVGMLLIPRMKYFPFYRCPGPRRPSRNPPSSPRKFGRPPANSPRSDWDCGDSPWSCVLRDCLEHGPRFCGAGPHVIGYCHSKFPRLQQWFNAAAGMNQMNSNFFFPAMFSAGKAENRGRHAARCLVPRRGNRTRGDESQMAVGQRRHTRWRRMLLRKYQPRLLTCRWSSVPWACSASGYKVPPAGMTVANSVCPISGELPGA